MINKNNQKIIEKSKKIKKYKSRTISIKKTILDELDDDICYENESLEKYLDALGEHQRAKSDNYMILEKRTDCSSIWVELPNLA